VKCGVFYDLFFLSVCDFNFHTTAISSYPVTVYMAQIPDSVFTGNLTFTVMSLLYIGALAHPVSLSAFVKNYPEFIPGIIEYSMDYSYCYKNMYCMV